MYNKKNKRSISSSSNAHIQHHSSLVSLASEDIAFQDKLKKYQYSEIQKKYIVPAYTTIHALEEKPTINGSVLVECRKMLKSGMLRLRQHNKQMQQEISDLKNGVKQKEKDLSLEISTIKSSFEEEMKMLENQNNQNIMNLNAEFGRKQQEYRQITSKSLTLLTSIRKKWNQHNKTLLSESQKLYQTLQNRFFVDQHNSEVYDKIVQFTDKILYGEQSLSQESCDFDDKGDKLSSYREDYKKNTIQMSSIEQIDREDPVSESQSLDEEFDKCLTKMVNFGFFCEQNKKYIKDLIQISKAMEGTESILQSAIYPLLVEGLKMHIRKECLMEKQSEESVQNSRQIIMRDISNIEDLSLCEKEDIMGII